MSFTPAEIAERTLHRHAGEATIWGMPAVNYQLMFREMIQKCKGGFNQIVYWPWLLDWKNQTLMPNPDVIYLNEVERMEHHSEIPTSKCATRISPLIHARPWLD